MAVLHQNPRLSPALPGPQSEQETTCRKNSSPVTLVVPNPCSSQPFAFSVPHDQDHVTTITTTTYPTTFDYHRVKQPGPMDGYQLAALHVLMDPALLVHMLCTGAAQQLRQAKASSTCPESLWETFGVWVFVCIVFCGFVCCPTWLDYRRLKSKSYRQQ